MERDRSFTDKVIDTGAEISKKVDLITIPVGAGLYLLGSPIGGPLIIFSAITYFGADRIQKNTR